MKPYSRLGQVRLGSQLRMFAEMVTADAAAIYESFELDIDPKWFPVFYILATETDSTVTSIASAIGHSHVSVSKIVAELSAAKLVESKKCASDSRRTLINLSRSGQRLVPKLKRQCEQVDRALHELTDDTGVDLWRALTITQRSLRYFPLSERVKRLDEPQDLRIVDYAPKYAEDFKRLNVEWISQHWELEKADEDALNGPEEYIIDRGGAILIALYKATPVGTVALIPYDATTLELAKMAVSPVVQGKGFGLCLGEYALKRARQMGAKRVYLESNTKLGPALALYRKLGFKPLQGPESESPYARCNVRMETLLQA